VLGALSLLSFYWVWLNGVGLRDGGEKVNSTTAWSAALGIYGLLILLSAIVGLLFGSFLS
jgi:hypothetical protein